LSPYYTTSVSEFFLFFGQCSCFSIFDDLSKHACCYREISLLLRRAPGREAYPGEIFFVHSRLLERSSKVSFSLGGGSLTSFPVIETLAGDLGAFIATNVISITDGQIALSQELFNSGIKPSVDTGLSVTRVGSSAQWAGMKLFGAKLKLDLSQYSELQSFSQFSSDLPKSTIDKLSRCSKLVRFLQQPNLSPMQLFQQVLLLGLAAYVTPCFRFEMSALSEVLTTVLLLPSWLFLFLPTRALFMWVMLRWYFRTPTY
jgi:F-type H+-transporting ATPase subunit alpha